MEGTLHQAPIQEGAYVRLFEFVLPLTQGKDLKQLMEKVGRKALLDDDLNEVSPFPLFFLRRGDLSEKSHLPKRKIALHLSSDAKHLVAVTLELIGDSDDFGPPALCAQVGSGRLDVWRRFPVQS